MTDIGTAVSFLVAVSDLAVVKDIRNAIRANLLARGGIEGPLGNTEMPHRDPPTRNLESQIRFERKPLVAGVTTYAQRPIVRDVTVVERTQAVPAIDRIEPTDCEPRTTAKEGPLAPPWRMPIVPETASCRTVIKCPPPPPDVINKGSLLDFFM
jgi:hypothetical protein